MGLHSLDATDRPHVSETGSAPLGGAAAVPPARPGRLLLAHLVGWLVAAAVIASTGRFDGFDIVATLISLIYVSLFPGDALRAALRVRADDVHLRVLVVFAGSIFMVLLAALLSIAVFSGRPDIRPLDPLPLFGMLSLEVLVCLVAVAFSRRHAPAALPDPLQWLAWGVLAIVVQLTWLGAKLLDRGDGPWLSAIGLGLLGLAVVGGAVSRRDWVDRLRPAFLFFLTLGVSWSFSQRGDYLFGFDLHQEHVWAQRTLDAGTWTRVAGDPYAAMLSITALPASLSSLTGLDIVEYFKVFAPMAFALYTLGAFLFISRFTTRTTAYVVTLLLVFIPQALWQLPAVSRQEIALLEFAVTLLLMFGAGGPGLGPKVFACCTALALAVTHYTSAYITLAILLGGLVLTWLWRLVRPGWRRAPRHIPVLVVVVLAVGSIGWHAVYTSSTLNVGSAVDKSGSGGLRQESSLLQTFLNGGNIAEVPPAEYFAETELDAQERPWLVPYSTSLQQQFIAEAREITLPEEYGPAKALAPVSEPLFTALRQLGNLLMAGGVVLLLVRYLRRRRPREGDEPDILALAAVALLITAATRFNADLSQAYNPERLLLQTAFFLGVGAAILGRGIVLWARSLPWLRDRAVLTHRGPRVVIAVLATLLVFDATGLRALTIAKDAGNLKANGEYAQRFALDDADLAAATWLGNRFQPDDMLFADSYGVLAPRGMPRFDKGLFGEISPYTLDQRSYVLATSENVEGGRTRTVKRSVRSTFVFPIHFLSTYKSMVYNNGSAEVFR